MTQRYLHSLPTDVQYEMEENQFGGRKLIGQARVVAHSAQKVGGPALPNWPPLERKREVLCEAPNSRSSDQDCWHTDVVGKKR